jgi:hypothetical protein
VVPHELLLGHHVPRAIEEGASSDAQPRAPEAFVLTASTHEEIRGRRNEVHTLGLSFGEEAREAAIPAEDVAHCGPIGARPCWERFDEARKTLRVHSGVMDLQPGGQARWSTAAWFWRRSGTAPRRCADRDVSGETEAGSAGLQPAKG